MTVQKRTAKDRDPRPIGVFDSGVGGLCAVREIRRLLPRESLVYFGDTARIPYGTRSAGTVCRYAAEDVRFLLEHDPKAIVIACGTVSANALDVCRASCNVPVIGVIDPACSAALASTKNRKIGVIATSSTIASGAYEKTLSREAPDVSVISCACPLFVPLVENGFVSPDDPVPLEVARRYLAPIAEAECDTLILGCTHYPHLSAVIEKVLPGVRQIDTGVEVAHVLCGLLREEGLETDAQTGTLSLFVSDDPAGFAKSAETFLGSPAEGVQGVSLQDAAP